MLGSWVARVRLLVRAYHAARGGQRVRVEGHDAHRDGRVLPANKGLSAAERGLPLESQSQGAPYFGFVSSQGLVRSLDGEVHPAVSAEDEFLAELDGRPFALFVEDLRMVVR